MHVPFVIATFVGAGLPFFATRRSERARRCVFLTGLAVATVSAFFIAYPPDWESGAWLSVFVGGLMVLNALRLDSYVVLGNASVKVSAMFTSSQRLWWSMVPGMALCVFQVGWYVFVREGPVMAVVSATVLVVIPSAFGYLNGRAGESIADRQALQFVLVSIVTAGVFTLLYLVAYATGRCAGGGTSRPRHYR